MEYRSGQDPTYSGSTAAETTLQCKSEFLSILSLKKTSYQFESLKLSPSFSF